MSNLVYKARINVFGAGLPSSIFRECMESVHIEGLGDTWRFKQRPPMIADEYFKGEVTTAILGLKSARRHKRVSGSPNPEFSEAADNAAGCLLSHLNFCVGFIPTHLFFLS